MGSIVGYDTYMIAHIKGKLLYQEHGSVVIDVSGVGYRVFVTAEAAEIIRSKGEGSEVSLFTHLAVRENSLDIYGFRDKEERLFFEMLISISGIGPKSAISILSIADVSTLKDAVVTGDTTYLTKVSGIGRKSAQKIVLELNDKITVLDEEKSIALSEDVDTVEALIALGYSMSEARSALKNIPKDVIGTNNRLKEVLKLIGK